MTQTRKDACEAYGALWQTRHFDETTWKRILDITYDGHEPTPVARQLDLPKACMRSLQEHAREHRGWIGFMQGTRLKDRRLAHGARLTGAYAALVERLYEVALDPSTKPAAVVRALEVAQKERAELQKLATIAQEEMEREDGSQKPMEDLRAVVDRIAMDVLGMSRPDDS